MQAGILGTVPSTAPGASGRESGSRVPTHVQCLGEHDLIAHQGRGGHHHHFQEPRQRDELSGLKRPGDVWLRSVDLGKGQKRMSWWRRLAFKPESV